MFSGKCSWRDVFINSPANKQIWKGEDSLDNIWFNPILCDGRKVSFCDDKNNEDLLPPEDGGGGDPLALHADLHPVPPDRPPDHRGHPMSEDMR